MESYRFGENIRALLSELSSVSDHDLTLEQVDGYVWRLEVTHRELIAMDTMDSGRVQVGGTWRCGHSFITGD